MTVRCTGNLLFPILFESGDEGGGDGDLYYSQLGPWRQMLKIGLTTFAEKPEPTRSDCHAWSASPDYDFLATICGIMPDAPGFSRVLVRPELGELREVEGSMPHPRGMIRVKLRRTVTGIAGEVELPEGVSGRFVYGGKEVVLHGGDKRSVRWTHRQVAGRWETRWMRTGRCA